MNKTQENVKVLTEDINQIWNPKRFELIREPHVIGEITQKEDFLKGIQSVLDMPIKIPNSDIRIPSDLDTPSIREIVDKALEFEKGINPNWNNYYTYLTVHHSFVESDSTQRRAGAHIDGMQGVRYKDKLPVCHSYLVSNAIPTCFFNHPFPSNLDERTQNWFYEFDRVKDYTKATYSKPFEINLMTAYSVHESTFAKEDTLRTFVRLEFSLKEFNRIGNSINPLFKDELNWKYQDLSIPKHLAINEFN